MIKTTRKYIHLISRHSNWSEQGVKKALLEEVYNDEASWRKFLEVLFMTLGVSFMTAGVLFFFAYNWSDLHKFVKIGLVAGLLIVSTALILFTNINENIKNIILTGASVLVGVLFAIYGQVYQTGANAYDLFFGWTLAIALWVIVANFAALWLVFILLINTTMLLYMEQIGMYSSPVSMAFLLFAINAGFLITVLVGSKYAEAFKKPKWLTNLLAIGGISFSTWGIILGVFSHPKIDFWVFLALAILLYSSGYIYGLKNKEGIYLTIIPFSVIVILSALLIKWSDGAGTFFILSIFVVSSITLVIRNLIHLQKQWNDE